jgi:hypothetical protein
MHYKFLHPKFAEPTMKERLQGRINPVEVKHIEDQGRIPEEAYLPKWWKPFQA